jgi:chemotaxis protein MotB
MDSAQPVIVIRKKVRGHGGHHGGSWKVAYADFVTAMMALFIVLWLLSSSEQVRKAVGGYFMDPQGKGKLTGSSMAGTGESLMVKKEDMEQLRKQLEQAIRSVPELKRFQEQIRLTVTGEGLRIELLENEKGVFFELGDPKPNETCLVLLGMLGEQLGRLPNKIVMEGHTDAKPFAGAGSYTNWNLSADRATAALLAMQSSGLRSDQVVQVRGFADHQLFKPDDPLHASNRRISVIVQYVVGVGKPAAPTQTGAQTAQSGAQPTHSGAQPAQAGAH